MDKSGNMPKKNFLSFQIDPAKFATASDAEKAQQVTQRQSVSYMRDAMRRLRANKLAMFCLCLLIFITLIAIIVPYVYPYNYTQQDVSAKHLMPFEYSRKEQARIDNGEFVFPHIMGTDNLGRDYCIRVIYGTRISLMVGFVAALIVVIIGIIYGSISGYFGGKVDLVMMRIVDIIYSLPDVLIVILLSVAIKDFISTSTNDLIIRLGPGMISIFIVFGLLYWVSMARQVRGQVLSIKEQEYVLAARATGASAAHIIRKHMLPNCISVIIITAAMQIPSAIFTESFLSFVGLGVSMPMPSLGSLASDARSGLISYPYLLLFPALSIFLIVFHSTCWATDCAMRSIPSCVHKGGYAMAMLEVRDLHTSFFTPAGEVKAVNGISFNLDSGKVLGIVGESGSGKSVTAYSILQILAHPGRIVSGSIKFRGKELVGSGESEMRKIRGNKISIIFQDPMTSLNPVYTVGNQLEEAIRLHTGRNHQQARERAIEMLTLVGINEPQKRLKQYPFELSGGMRQRVMIAMALACEPDILIADEPTTALDVTIQRRFWN